MPKSRDDNFLLRWSRRKRAATQDPSALDETSDAEAAANQPSETDFAAAAPPAPSAPPDDAEHEDEAVPPEIADIDIETLDYDADYTKFLKDGVPEALKRRALRRLWRTNPVLANIDGLNDYDDDFTDAALAVDVLKTVHKVGRGYLEEDDETEIDDDLDDGDGAEVATGTDRTDEKGDTPPTAESELETEAVTAETNDEDPDGEPQKSA